MPRSPAIDMLIANITAHLQDERLNMTVRDPSFGVSCFCVCVMGAGGGLGQRVWDVGLRFHNFKVSATGTLS